MYRLVVHLSTHYVNVMHAGILDYVAKSHNLFYYFVKYMSTSILFTVDLIQFIRPRMGICCIYDSCNVVSA